MKLYLPAPQSLHWDAQGTPVSGVFQDIYFSAGNGLQESRYVFLHGNDLPARFNRHPRSLFIIAETGFGTGLNFLALRQAFDHFRQQQPQSRLRRLHFISCEKYPLSGADLAAAHAAWPELKRYADELQQQWPPAVAGCHRLLFDNGQVSLDLWFGDITQLTDAFDDTLNRQVDAWFLDGFAPAKNPEMWSEKVLCRIAQMTRPGGTFATFTAAGVVRRGLQQAGFCVSKCKGFAKKREMLTGVLTNAPTLPARTPWYTRPAATGQDIAIIGGGIASAVLALALLRRGKCVTLYCADNKPAGNASGNRQGALYPLLNGHDEALKRFFPTAFSFARRFYDSLPVNVEHDWCGVTQLAYDEKSAAKIAHMLTLNLPDSLAYAVDKATAEKFTQVKTGCGGIHYPNGGWLAPAELTCALLTLAQQQGLRIQWQHSLERLEEKENGWRLHFNSRPATCHQNVVLANGHTLTDLSQSAALPLYPVAGQVSHIPARGRLAALRQVLCYDGYLTPRSQRFATHCLGATYHRGSRQTAYRPDDQQNNYDRLRTCLPDADWTEDIDISDGDARCGVRCAVRDHLPVIGALPDYAQTCTIYANLPAQQAAGETISPSPVWKNLFVFGALGSRGLCSAPLAGEILAAQLCNEPLPMDADTLAALNPNRFWIRKLLKGKAPAGRK